MAEVSWGFSRCLYPILGLDRSLTRLRLTTARRASAATLFRGNFVAFGNAFLQHRGAFAVKGDALEQVHGPLQLNVMSVAHSLLVLRLNRVDPAGGAFEEDIMLLLI